MKTLLQIQDEVSINRGYSSIDRVLTLCGSTLVHIICTEAGEIYAEQFKRKWISVDERLPENDGECMVFMKEGTHSCCRYFYSNETKFHNMELDIDIT